MIFFTTIITNLAGAVAKALACHYDGQVFNPWSEHCFICYNGHWACSMFIVHLPQLLILPIQGERKHLQMLSLPLEREDKQLQMVFFPPQIFICLHMWEFPSSYKAQSDVKYIYSMRLLHNKFIQCYKLFFCLPSLHFFSHQR